MARRTNIAQFRIQNQKNASRESVTLTCACAADSDVNWQMANGTAEPVGVDKSSGSRQDHLAMPRVPLPSTFQKHTIFPINNNKNNETMF